MHALCCAVLHHGVVIELAASDGEQDVRWVMAQLRVAGDPAMDAVPWGRFSHAYGMGDDVPALLEALSDPDPGRAARALDELWNKARHQGNSDTVLALAVPFLLRIAAVPTVHSRHRILRLAAEAGHRNHFEVDVRTDLFQVADEPDALEIDGFGRPMVWTQQAAREAVAADAHLLIEMLDDPDELVRANAAYGLAGALSPGPRAQAALRARLDVEACPPVRISLVLAIAQLSVLHGDPDVVDWTRMLWSDATHSPEVRFAAALGWLCATREPVPDGMLDLFGEVVGPELAESMTDVPWPDRLDESGGLVGWLSAFLDEPLAARRARRLKNSVLP